MRRNRKTKGNKNAGGENKELKSLHFYFSLEISKIPKKIFVLKNKLNKKLRNFQTI